jgi:D-alanine-D-alanine ligase
MINSEPCVGVICGGPSAEAEVSRVSAAGVAEALRRRFAAVRMFELSPNVGSALKEAKVDVVFPVLHGPPGEDGTFQGMLEIMGLPYVGSGVQASSVAMDKVLAKQLFRIEALPVAPDVIVRRQAGVDAAARAVAKGLNGEVVVKPARQGSALGVRFASDEATLKQALAEAFRYDERVLVERRMRGREITVALLERNGLEALPVIEIRTPPGSWYDYEHRYTPGWSEHIIPAPLPPEQYQRTQAIAKAAHEALGCRDLSRVDFVVPERGEPVLLEVNTLPGMTPTSLYPDAARAAGIDFEALVAHLVQRALARARSD